MRFKLFILSFFIFVSLSGQQFPGMSQYMFTGMAVNPAYAGSHEAFAASLLYRNQWIGIQGAPLTNMFSAHTPLKNHKVALGLTVYNESFGIQSNTGAFLNYAFRFRIGKGKFSLGLKGGMDMFDASWDEVKTIETNDESFMNPSTSYMFPNFGFGTYYYSNRFFFGLSVPFIFSYKETSSGNGFEYFHEMDNYNYFITTGGTLINGNTLKIQPSVFVRYQKATGPQFDFTNFFVFNDLLWVGASYRMSEELAAILQYKVNKQLRIGYAYDYSLGYLNSYSNGTHEILLQYEFSFYVEAVNPRF